MREFSFQDISAALAIPSPLSRENSIAVAFFFDKLLI